MLARHHGLVDATALNPSTLMFDLRAVGSIWDCYKSVTAAYFVLAALLVRRAGVRARSWLVVLMFACAGCSSAMLVAVRRAYVCLMFVVLG